MIDPERIQRLAAKMGNREDALEMVRQMRCGGKMYPGGGKFFRTNLQNESPLMYQPMMPINYPIETPLRFRPQPDLGDYQAPASTGMVVDYPITLPERVPVTIQDSVSAPVVVEAPAENLFSDEAKARRRLMQRYAESLLDDKASSPAGAKGPWQIMDITVQDYLNNGGKPGDIFDPEYNGGIRDWAFSVIPKRLGEFWSENDSDINKLAKLYAAYNWGAGNLKKFLRSRIEAGLGNDDPYEWVEAIKNKGKRPNETKNYVKFLALNQDIPGSYLTRDKFEKSARARGYMAEGGRLYWDGGDKDDEGIYLGELRPAVIKPEPVKVVLRTDGISKDTPITHSTLVGPGMLVSKGMDDPSYDLFRSNCSDATGEILGSISGVDLTNGITTPYGLARRVSDVFGGYPGYMEQFNGLDAIQSFEVPWYDYRVARDIATKKRAELVDYELKKAGVSDEKRKAAVENVYNSSPLLPYRLDDYASGGKIHIKPENRGKFTALKKRTGHSASWFKAHGTPAQKKMAVFALNAKKWKHGDGGPIDRYSPEQIRAAIAKLKEAKK